MPDWLPTDFPSWLRKIDKRVGFLERRTPPIPTAPGGIGIFGTLTNAPVPSGGTRQTAIVFPSGSFEVAPLVFVSSTGARLGLAAGSITATGFNFITDNWSPAASDTDTLRWWAHAV